MQTEVDHIVVGGGSAGCAVAAPLAEQPGAQVCVIEAGPPDRDIPVTVPFGLVKPTRSNADANVLPRITSANTNAPSMMIGWQIGGHVAAAAAERLAA